jgi:SNF2 family DNA or RNA helicase
MEQTTNSTQPLKIPGLVPTMRPYQEAAVAWMLERETRLENGVVGNEWELAWVVVVAAQLDNNTGMNQQSHVILPLPEWKDRDGTTNVLLMCPFTGWLVDSYEAARAATILPEFMVASPKGGILAESMGLGKTVEVLACILAHPRPQPKATPVPRAQQKLDFAPPDESCSTTETYSSETPAGGSRVGVVADLEEFGDAEESSDEEIEVNELPDTTTKSRVPVDESTTLIVSYTEERKLPVPVTPDKVGLEKPSKDAEIRWLDNEDSTLGSCICGNVIGWSDLKKSYPIIVCQACEEPMHNECAAFCSQEEMEDETTPLVYKRMFSDKSWKARLCDKSRCPCCVGTQQISLPSRATLIITPPAILSQWEREIQRHTITKNGKPLEVLVYNGVESICKSSEKRKRDRGRLMKLVHPRILADADIVLMTFDALMSDLGHSDDNRFLSGTGDSAGNNLRKRKRYRVVPSPLTSIRWWRVCLDEAQRVETPTAGSARMALKLQADHRWAVSGTPIGRGKLEDLYGLLLFLRMDPFSDKLWFNKCFGSCHRFIDERIRCLLKDIFWRSTKSLDTVRDQMGVPEQIEKKVVLRFSSIEKHFYDRQLEHTLSVAGELADRAKSGKRKASQLDLLAEHLHRLRAACCHPQVGSTGIGKAKKHRVAGKNGGEGSTVSVSSRVMSMDQILDRFIDDSKLKCEEAQRLALLHTNGMAAISKLKVEAKQRDVDILESDTVLLSKSCKLYLESLEIGEENAKPTLVVGEAVLSGTTGFQSSQKIIRDGKCLLGWKLPGLDARELWSRFDFEGPARKISQVRVRSIHSLPDQARDETSDDFSWQLLHPKECVFQVSSVAVGGEFVDVAAFSLPPPSDDDDTNAWIAQSGFRTNKSKNWRFVVKSFHETESEDRSKTKDSNVSGLYVGLKIELFEADIASDPLQRLHCLHNASLSFMSLLELHEGECDESYDEEEFLPFAEMRQRVKSMGDEATKIESLYLDLAGSIHADCHRRLQETSEHRKCEELKLFDLSTGVDPKDVWDDAWHDDFLVMCRLYGTETQQRQVYERLLHDLDGFLGGALGGSMHNDVAFPEFGSMNGLRTALNMRIQSIRTGLGKGTSRRSRAAIGATAEGEEYKDRARDGLFKCPQGAHNRCIDFISKLSSHPTEGEVLENSHCQVCKADWKQTGPKCRHCKIGDLLEELNPDRVTMLVLTSINNVVKSALGAAILRSSKSDINVDARAKMFFEVLEAEKREKLVASRLWRIHLDLLNDLDELNQCKSTMRLTYDGEDLSVLLDDQLNAIVMPIDVKARYHDHAAKQAMALGDLRRAKDTLRYLKNQSVDRVGQHAQDGDEDQCAVCLSGFDGDRAVLKCGHSFHYSPCLEQLQSRSGSTVITCPLRCKLRTTAQEVMIASEKRRDDGSRIKRQVKGSWGTKVTRLVADVLDVVDLGEKSIVFSQWEDMLDIAEEALTANGVNFVRSTSIKRIGECTKHFRSQDCSVLLLNVKNGAEGLTILEATHVFMIEPLLNCGLDSQGT